MNMALSHPLRIAQSPTDLLLMVDGVHCGGCIGRIESAIAALPGVVSARLNFTTRRLAVTYDSAKISEASMIKTIETLGYRAFPFDEETAKDVGAARTKWLLRCLAVSGFAAMNVMLLSVSVWTGHGEDMAQEQRDVFHGISGLIALPAIAYAGQPFFRSALDAIRSRSLNMDVPISLGVLLASAMSVIETINHAPHAYFDSAVMLLFFLLCGRYLDDLTRSRTRKFAANLAAMRPRHATRVDPFTKATSQVPAASLEKGDICLVMAGDRVPVDGRILSGNSAVDESMITGETIHRTVTLGDEVYASSLNSGGSLTIQVEKAGDDTVIGDIERLLENSATTKSRYTRLADRVSRAYAPIVHLTALATASGWLIWGASLHDAVVIAISVLIITCPCALALAIPTVQIVGSGLMFKQGILLNAGDLLERLATVDTVIFDKTGTLTLPEAAILNVEELEDEAVTLLARLAMSSRHPLARVVAQLRSRSAPLQDAIERPGEGVEAMFRGVLCRLGSAAFCDVTLPEEQSRSGQSSICFRIGQRVGILYVSQQLRPDAAATTNALRNMGLRLAIASGDRADAVAPVATATGIKEWTANCKPAEKIELIKSLQASGSSVLMVGDGMNDAPALATGQASISPISASDLAQAHSDAVFLGASLAPAVKAIRIARGARSVMVQNLLLALVYNLIAVPLAMAGHVTPLIAAAAMSGSSILVTLNALRLNLTSAAKTSS